MNLTVVGAGGLGSRGKIPGGIEEIAVKGMLRRFIGGHHETHRAFLKMAEAGDLILQCIPQGTLAILAAAQGEGLESLTTDVGGGTFIDPRVGPGTAVANGQGETFVAVDGDKLRFHLTPIDTALVWATGADREDNVYMHTAHMRSEFPDAVSAARRNGSRLLVAVPEIIDPTGPDGNVLEPFLKAEDVAAIEVFPAQEQTIMVPQRKFMKAFVPGNHVDPQTIVDRATFLNSLLKVDPIRGSVQRTMARATARTFTTVAKPGAHVIIGYGLPQNVGKLFSGNLDRDITFLVETGVMGGIPAPGIYFGAAINPQKLISSSEMFQFCRNNLDVVIIGMLQADEKGNANVSRRGDGPSGFVGPGGFMDLATSAKHILFIGPFMAKSNTIVENGRLRMLDAGIPKFVKAVDEITFSGRQALNQGKTVHYITDVGTFKLTNGGLELCAVMPGIDIEKDILANTSARIMVPANVNVLDESVVTGRGFMPVWQSN